MKLITIFLALFVVGNHAASCPSGQCLAPSKKCIVAKNYGIDKNGYCVKSKK